MWADKSQQLTATVYLIEVTEWEKLRHSEVRESGWSGCACVCVCVCARLGFQSHTEWCWFTEWLGDSRSGVTAGHTKSDSGCWEGMWIKVQSMKIHPLTLRGLVLGCMTARTGLQALGRHLHMWAMIWISGTFSSPWGILLTLRMLGVHSHCHVFNGGR